MLTIGLLTALGLAVGASFGKALGVAVGSYFTACIIIGIIKGGTTQMLKHYVMPIHTPNGATVCTPDGFAMKQRIERLKRELRINRKINKI